MKCGKCGGSNLGEVYKSFNDLRIVGFLCNDCGEKVSVTDKSVSKEAKT